MENNLEHYLPDGHKRIKELDSKITNIRTKSDFLRNQSVSASNREKVGALLYPKWSEYDAVRKSNITINVPAIPLKNDIRFRNVYERYKATLIRLLELEEIAMDTTNRNYPIAKDLILSNSKFSNFIRKVRLFIQKSVFLIQL